MYDKINRGIIAGIFEISFMVSDVRLKGEIE